MGNSLVANNSTYATAIHMISQAVAAGTFVLALIALIVVLVFGDRFEGKSKRWCSSIIQQRIVVTLLIIMILAQILVWALVQGFDLIPVWAAALLCLFIGVPLILITDRVIRKPDFHPGQFVATIKGFFTNSSPVRRQAYQADILLPDAPLGMQHPPQPMEALNGNTHTHHVNINSNGTNNTIKSSHSTTIGGGKTFDRPPPAYKSAGHASTSMPLTAATLLAIIKNNAYVIFALISYFVLCFLAIFLLHGVCWCTNPSSITTWVTRLSDQKVCVENQFCHLYPLLGVNSSRIRLVGHVVTSNGRPFSTHATICPITLVGATYTSSDPCASPEWYVEGVIYDHDQIDEDRRFLSHIVLKNLAPRTYYRATVYFTLSNGASISRSTMFRTISAPDDTNSTVRFISGGDFYTGRAGKECLREALALEPLPDFIYIGGDISYANNIRYCYRRLDYSLDIFANLRTQMGVSIPFLYIVGNHESGGYLKDTWNKFFFHQQYFPNFDSDVDPSGLQETHHRHILSGTVGMVNLDSGCIEEVAAQNQYLRDSLTWIYEGWTPNPSDPSVFPPLSARLAIVSYHNPAYPSLRAFDNTQSVLVREHWIPIIDQYKVPLVLEFHDHAYKRTYPVKGHEVQQAGKGTVYIGDGGMGLERDVDKDDGNPVFLERKILQHNIQIVAISPNKEIHVRTFGDNYEFLDETRLYRLT